MYFFATFILRMKRQRNHFIVSKKAKEFNAFSIGYCVQNQNLRRGRYGYNDNAFSLSVSHDYESTEENIKTLYGHIGPVQGPEPLNQGS